MSRIGRKEIILSTAVKVKLKNNMLVVTGPKGELMQYYDPHISFDFINDTVIQVKRANNTHEAKAKHGLYRKLLANMIEGVNNGFTKILLISGTGYRAEIKEKNLFLNLGYSNQIEYLTPDNITITCETPTKVIISGIDKQLVGQTAANIRSIRKPATYSNKGIRYSDEIIKRKVGKTGVK